MLINFLGDGVLDVPAGKVGFTETRANQEQERIRRNHQVVLLHSARAVEDASPYIFYLRSGGTNHTPVGRGAGPCSTRSERKYLFIFQSGSGNRPGGERRRPGWLPPRSRKVRKSRQTPAASPGRDRGFPAARRRRRRFPPPPLRLRQRRLLRHGDPASAAAQKQRQTQRCRKQTSEESALSSYRLCSRHVRSFPAMSASVKTGCGFCV